MAALTETLTQHFDVGETATVYITNPVGEVSILSGETCRVSGYLYPCWEYLSGRLAGACQAQTCWGKRER
jgi:predicted RNA-binding Zn-ribbon protein involved in translation (DUF1610 family)